MISSLKSLFYCIKHQLLQNDGKKTEIIVKIQSFCPKIVANSHNQTELLTMF